METAALETILTSAPASVLVVVLGAFMRAWTKTVADEIKRLGGSMSAVQAELVGLRERIARLEERTSMSGLDGRHHAN